ncbi:uncharacterized protein LOC109124010 isoform X1 [Vitis vinifera]|uniref:uncharacterized protein LOC109124010 isoform X1 n=1 Tax=Vitis vinifera TaxID=29760 RepID=UPI0008FECBFF|nr:uncharacterized protein LOC109124010 isoform X1 [Vitis vinifera]|eukprot:XP_019081045.1 PREDICTED: uncharacterized protein LOC109124010 [Vitis vinifera]
MAIQNPSDPIPTQNPSDPIPTQNPSNPIPTQNPSDPIPTQNPDPTPIWISCNHCRRRFVSMQNIQAVVVQARDPSSIYYVADDSYRIFRPGIFSHPKEVSFEWIRAANQTTNLVVGRMYCSKCAQPAGWKVARFCCQFLLLVLATKNLNAVVQCDKHVGAISSE